MCDIRFDELGPSKVIQLYAPELELKAMVVVDNTVLGPAIGGIRVSPAVTLEEVARLARTMTLKNSIAGLPHGGGKAGIVADPKDPRKEAYFRTFARSIKDIIDYIPGPDMGSDEKCMAWVHDEIGRAVGLPEEIGGLPLDKLGATGYGLAECAEVAGQYAGVRLRGASVAIQGFGSVGKAAARFLSAKGAAVVAVSDTKGTIYSADGIDVDELIKIKETVGSVVNYKKGAVMSQEEIFSIQCDILVPAATPDAVNAGNARGVRAKMIIEGANIPVTTDAHEVLYEKGVLVVPDFIANAGGVIMAAMEYAKKNGQDAFSAISAKIRTNTKLILDKSAKERIPPRSTAMEIARDRLIKAMKSRGE